MIYKSGADFLQSKTKALTLMGMSGVGKSHLSGLMEGWGWRNFSCDLEIGTKELAAEMARPVILNDISSLSEFIGKIGEVPFNEFKRRQKLYYDAEIAALSRVPEAVRQADKTVIDSTGSICEILDEDVIGQVGRASLIIYIEASKDEEKAILQRAQDYPKPLFYPPRQLEAWVNEYMQICGVDHADHIPADDFARWVFPRLFDLRIPKYQEIAERYGITLSTADLYQVKTESDVLGLIAAALDAQA
jgi:hypothetical protein